VASPTGVHHALEESIQVGGALLIDEAA
jgi:hypothetical protein